MQRNPSEQASEYSAESMFDGSRRSLKDRIIGRTVGQRHRSNDVMIAGTEEENSSGSDDLTPI